MGICRVLLSEATIDDGMAKEREVKRDLRLRAGIPRRMDRADSDLEHMPGRGALSCLLIIIPLPQLASALL